MEQDAKQKPSSQIAERAWGGLQAFSSSKELRELSVRAQARRINISLVLCCESFLNTAPLTQRNEAQRIEVRYRVSISGRYVSWSRSLESH